MQKEEMYRRSKDGTDSTNDWKKRCNVSYVGRTPKPKVA
jgi:hypothetical protein